MHIHVCECMCVRAPRGGHPVDTPRRFRRSPLKTIRHNGAPLLSLERERSYFIILIYTRATLCLKRGINGSGARGAFQRDVRERVCILRGLKKPRAWKNARERAILCNGGKGGILPREGWYSLFFLFLNAPSIDSDASSCESKLSLSFSSFFHVNREKFSLSLFRVL